MIRNIIFDVGKVLVSFEPEEYMKRLGFDERERAVVNRAMFQSRTWVEADRGTITPEESLEAYIAEAPEFEEQIRKAHEKVGDTVELLPYVMEWLTELKGRGFGIYILSNYGKHLFEQTKEKMEFLKLADGAVFSYACRMLKPERGVYENLRNKYNLNLAECVFLDDRQENIDGAKAAGMQGILFRNYEEAKEKLKELLSFQK